VLWWPLDSMEPSGQPLGDLAAFAPRRAYAVRHEGPPVRRVRRSPRQDQRLVAELAAQLATSLDLGAILLESMRLLHDRFGYGNVAIFLADTTRRWLELRATYGDMVDAEAHAHYRQPVGQGLLGAAFESGQVVRVDDVRGDPRYLGALDGSTGEMCVPLVARGQVIGVLDVQVRDANYFRDQDEALLREVAERLAPVLHNAALYEESQRRSAELQVLAEVARAISAQVTPDAVVDDVHRQVRRVVPVERSTVALRREIVSAVWPRPGEGPLSPPRAHPAALSLLAAEGERPSELMVVRSFRGDERVRDDEGTIRPLDAAGADAIERRAVSAAGPRLVAPLLAGDLVLGLMTVEGRAGDAYDDWHAGLLGTIANQAAVALHNACLLAMTEGALGELQRSRQQVTAAEERLRREIAELLHGRVQSRLIVAWHRLGQCQRLLASDPAEASRILADVREEIDQVREQGLRQASHLLHPAVIGVGLVPAVRALLARYEDCFACALEVDGGLARLDDPVENHLPEPLRLTAYRVLEEMLANANRHARATRVMIRLTLDGHLLRVVVSDDGCGFDPDARGDGLGLVSIAGRVAQVGGSWSIESAPGAGTMVGVALPLTGARVAAGPT
jgi:signal transduction histidine kinase/putative methionine-R-sulfoxide reductase with GAF domain